MRFSLVARSELARSNLPGVTISGTMASLAGSKKTPAVAIAKLSANTARQRTRGDQGNGQHEDRPEDIDCDHEPALVEPVDQDTRKGSEQDVGETVEREHGACAKG